MGIKIGMPTIGGLLAVFFATTQDYYLRAFDSANGQEFGKGRFPVGS